MTVPPLFSYQLSPFSPLMASITPTNTIPTREDEDNVFQDVQRIFDKLLKFLAVIIAFKLTDAGQHFSKTNPYMMVALVLVIMLYFSAWLLVTAPQLHTRRTLLSFITYFVLIIGVIVSVWALIVTL